MALFVKYLNRVEIYPLLLRFFGDIRRDNKGLPVWKMLVINCLDPYKYNTQLKPGDQFLIFRMRTNTEPGNSFAVL